MAIKKETTEVRREQIVKAALTIIGDEGVQGLTTSKIAKLVGVSEANLYRHFKNKDAILTAVVDDLEQTLSNNLTIVNAEAIAPLEKLECIFKLQLKHIAQNRGIPRIVFSSEVVFRKDLREKLSSFISHYIGMLAGILDSGIRDGSIKCAGGSTITAGMFVGMIQLSVLRWSLSGFKTSLLDEGDKLWEAYKENLECQG
ncbi:MAG: TetR/AcrR family transcriptional regulator [Deltaproteobacteria bacterium]|nr:TetR/AcrR family transcriptional regulator [Deltaproteobacteria bacterium]